MFQGRTVLLLPLIIGLAGVVKSQGYTSSPSVKTPATINLGETLRNDFLKFSTQNIKGTPFLNDSFLYSDIWLYDNKSYSLKTRLNLITQKLHFLNEAGSELTTTGESVKKVTFFSDTSSHNSLGSLTFSCGYPEINGNSYYTFYQQMNDGKVILLKHLTKVLITHAAAPTMPVYKEFEEGEIYYIYNSGNSNIQKLKKTKDFVLNFLTEKRKAVQNFIDSTNINLKHELDLLKLLEYYNSLN